MNSYSVKSSGEFREHILLTFLVLVCFFTMFLLTSCGSIIYDYPGNWPKQILPKTEGQCPDVAGTYHLYGSTNNETKNDKHFTGCLLHHLYAESGLINAFTGEYSDISTDLQNLINSADCIELAQPSPEQLEIITWGSHENGRYILHQESLTSAKGDFSCDQQGLHLKTRHYFLSVVISNMYVSERRMLLKAQDGSLLLNYVSRASGHHTFFPGSTEKSYWIRWEACPSEPSN
jgi:hypothetical protein